jgi:hypothetical protein
MHYPTIAPRFVGKPATDPGARHIKTTITEDEFAAMHWASKRAGTGSRRSVPLAEFMRQAILEKIARVAAATVARGGEPPQNVASVCQYVGRVGS